MPSLFLCLAYAGGGVFLLLVATTLLWTSAMFLCRWVGKVAKARRLRKTNVDMEANCNITPLILQPRRPTPRFAPHPPRCSCPVHVSSHLDRNLHVKQPTDLEISPQKYRNNDTHTSSTSPTSTFPLSDDNISGCTGGFITLCKSRKNCPPPERKCEHTQSPFINSTNPCHEPSHLDSKSDASYDVPKALSVAHSTIIQPRTKINSSEEKDFQKNSSSVPPILWALFSPSNIGLVLASGLLAKFSGERKKEDECAEDINSLHRIADAFGARHSSQTSRTARYRHSLARGSRISGMRYEGGYKQGLHTVAYRCHLLKTARSSIQEVSASRASVVPVVTTPVPTPPEPSLIVTVIPRNPLEHDPTAPPGLDLPPPKVITRGHVRGSQENLLPPYQVGLSGKMSILNKMVDEGIAGENKRRREILGLKVMNQ
ncbi:hypothetical protein E1B28_007246 [Marasmius oreades]|uniref:Uncharacterized protein n=1 Tax=Marasmius oreades TaxID=181124 RepID=A0A9P7S1X3_9AGAR|nr:uncharacterized protein E1B28_007246 [Marasmius oreades]KAG7093577.1 hypothetical protein E1B28_007246 [Marasmius oreades]